MNRIVFFTVLLSLILLACQQVNVVPTIRAAPTSTPTEPLPTLISENVYYVSTTGDDANPGTNNRPWRTIKKAANELVAGDTVYIRGGVYKEELLFQNSGTKDRPIRILAYPGEIPIIDGDNYQLPSSEWRALLLLKGDYLEVSGLEVQYSNWMGLALAGQHDYASHMNVHHSRETGILVSGNDGIVEKSRVWQNANRNEINSFNVNKGWATGLSAARHPKNVILRRNIVFNNWGEGLSTFEANGTTIEDNVVYDNWSANVYISDATDVLLQRNLIYMSPDSLINSGSRVGIMMGDETYNPPSEDITIINNLVSNTHILLYWWQGTQGGGMNNVLVANNTFVNSQPLDAGFGAITFGSSDVHHNVLFENNIIAQNGSILIGANYGNGILFTNNLWSSTPPANMSSPSDVIGDPALIQVGDYSSPEWFKLLPSSPAINRALAIQEVTGDYFVSARDTKPDIGAIEFTGDTPFLPNIASIDAEP